MRLAPDAPVVVAVANLDLPGREVAVYEVEVVVRAVHAHEHGAVVRIERAARHGHALRLAGGVVACAAADVEAVLVGLSPVECAAARHLKIRLLRGAVVVACVQNARHRHRGALAYHEVAGAVVRAEIEVLLQIPSGILQSDRSCGLDAVDGHEIDRRANDFAVQVAIDSDRRARHDANLPHG